MEKAAKPKGTVTSLSSLFPVEDAEKAAQRVHDTIADNQQRLDQLRGFAADNTSLVNLVGRLPDNLHHDVMVPFGKAAFFPGRLVHTNEFMVLLGEGYYAERTSKQTIEILKRRGKTLESQVHSLNAMVEDLKLEASFFSETASEAAEGALHITEFEEESSSETESEPGPLKQDSPGSSGANIRKVANEDEEFACIMSRMDELEREELEAESEIVSEEEESKSEFGAQSDNESDEDEKVKADVHQLSDQKSLDQNLRFLEESISRIPSEQTNDQITANRKKFTDQLSCSGPTVQSITEDRSSSGKVLASNVQSSLDKGSLPSEVDNVQAVPLSRSQDHPRSSRPEFDVQKAFPGSIVERTHNLQINSREQSTPNSQSSGSQPSKPVSRFKMQRR